MIAGGVGFIMAMLNLVPWLLQIRMMHFLVLVGGAIFLKLAYGFLYKDAADPINTNPLARKLFYAAMGILAVALLMRKYGFPYYNALLYLDIPAQIGALAISFSSIGLSKKELNEDVLDS